MPILPIFQNSRAQPSLQPPAYSEYEKRSTDRPVAADRLVAEAIESTKIHLKGIIGAHEDTIHGLKESVRSLEEQLREERRVAAEQEDVIKDYAQAVDALVDAMRRLGSNSADDTGPVVDNPRQERPRSLNSAEMANSCIVCMDQPPTLAVKGCGHLCMCAGCGDAIRQTHNKCPYCLGPIGDVGCVRGRCS